uniref:UAS domain-containing protein n=1 Tax=Rodentolepis nana TaxID=102285 RepID=A0A0R3TUI1_RODNA
LRREVGISKCPTTWSHSNSSGVQDPHIIHASMASKLETNFTLEEPTFLAKNVHDLIKRYVFHRSRFNIMNGYEFRHDPIKVPQFSFSKAMESHHSSGKLMSSRSICPSQGDRLQSICHSLDTFTFTTNHRIHPHFASQDHNSLTRHTSGVSLAISLNIKDISKMTELANQWTGWLSVAVYGTDGETIALLKFLNTFEPIGEGRANIFFHYVYQNDSFLERVALHNVAVTYAPTQTVLLVPNLDVDFSSLETLANSILVKSQSPNAILMASNFDDQCTAFRNHLCAITLDRIKTRDMNFTESIQGLMIQTGSSLLPEEAAHFDKQTQFLALIANSLSD